MPVRWIVVALALIAALGLSRAHANGKPSITITSPRDGATIQGSAVTVHVVVRNFKLVKPVLVPPSDWHKIPLLKGDQGHIHYLLDGLGNLVLTRDVVTGTTHTWTNVTPGQHTVTAYLATSQHGPFPGAKASTIHITVKPSAGSGSRSASRAPAPSIAITGHQVKKTNRGVYLRIRVHVSHFKLVPPVLKNPPMLRGNQGHIHYALDNMMQFIASRNATTALSHPWTNVSPGWHTVIVYLATSQHQLFPGTQPARVQVYIPLGTSRLYVAGLPRTGGANVRSGRAWDDAQEVLLAIIGALLMGVAIRLWPRPSAP